MRQVMQVEGCILSLFKMWSFVMKFFCINSDFLKKNYDFLVSLRSSQEIVAIEMLNNHTNFGRGVKLNMIWSTYYILRTVPGSGIQGIRLSLFTYGGQSITYAVNSVMQRQCLAHLRILYKLHHSTLCIENTQ